jgi:hypothetical protein
MNLFLNPHLIEACVWSELILASEGAACFLTLNQHLTGLGRCTPTKTNLVVGVQRAAPSPVQPMVPA